MSIANWLPGFFHLNCQLLLHWHWHSLATLTSSRWRCLIASDSFKEPLKGLPILYTLTRSPSLSLVCVCLANWPLHKYLPAHMFLATLRKLCQQQQDSRFFWNWWKGWAGLDIQQLDFSSSSNFIGFLIAFANRKQFNIEFLPVTGQGYAHTQNAHLCCIFFLVFIVLFFWGIFCTFCAYNRYQRG